MKKLFSTLLFGLLLSSAHAQVTGTAALVALDEIDASISKHVQSLDNLATNAIGNSGNMILTISARLRKDINETIGNTDQVLRENQLNVYNSLLNLSQDFNNVAQTNLNSVDLITTRITQTIDNFIIKKREPVIYKYIAQTFIKEHDKDYTFKVNGKNFNQSENIYMNLNNKKIKPIQITYSEIVFKIDSTDINATSKDKYFSKSEIVFEWEKGLFNSNKSTKIPFVISALPLNIGEATVFFEQSLPEEKYTDELTYSCSCRTGASSWSGSRRSNTVAFNVLPTGGRRIAPNSLRIVDWSQRHGGGNHFNFVTEQQIAGNITCRSDGKPRGGGGASNLTFAYREVETVYPIHKKQTVTQKITSINPIIFDLPNPVDNKRPNISYAIIKTFDNKQIIITPSTVNNYFELRINPATDDVIIAWKK